jgi:signal transduction histidine kinase
MHAILSYSALGIKKIKNTQFAVLCPESEKIITYFERINSSGERLLVFLNDLLDLSKLEARANEIKLEQFCLQDVIKKIVLEQYITVQEKNLNLQYEIDISNSLICSDKAKVQQLIYNFLSNAIKFSPLGGRINIGLKDKMFDQETMSIKALHFYIEDDGPGIPEDELLDIFNKFVQSSKTANGAGGTGLGLSISSEIAKLLNGKVWAENKIDKGSVFNFLLPLNN